MNYYERFLSLTLLEGTLKVSAPKAISNQGLYLLRRKSQQKRRIRRNIRKTLPKNSQKVISKCGRENPSLAFSTHPQLLAMHGRVRKE